MPKLLLARALPRTLVAAAVAFAFAAPADAKVVYRWKTDDGVYAFTDDAKRIPEKYRGEAKATPMRSLQSYKRYTPAQRSGTQAYLKRTERSAAEMAKLNARLSPTGEPVYVQEGAPSGEEAVLRVGTAGNSDIEIQTSNLEDSDAPIVIEQKRYYVPGLNSTRRDTIVRQGDKVLAITKPLPHQDDISTIPSEDVLPD